MTILNETDGIRIVLKDVPKSVYADALVSGTLDAIQHITKKRWRSDPERVRSTVGIRVRHHVETAVREWRLQ